MMDDPKHSDRAGIVLLATCLLVTAAWWALALAPVQEPPPWLAVARSVCFGSTPTGLPDTYGWLLLTLAPGSMLIGIFGVWGRDIASGLVRGWRNGLARAAIVASAVLMAAGTIWAGARVAEGLAIANTRYEPLASASMPDNYPRLDLEPPAFRLVDQNGETYTPAKLRGKVTLVTFAFAHCQTICPVIVNTIRNAAARMGSSAPQLLVVTLDPWRDTPSRLAKMHGDWALPAGAHILSGEVDDVTAALDGFNVPWQRNENDGNVVHPPLIYVIDADGRIAYGFNNPSVDWLVDASRRLLEEASAGVAAR
jgi:cytochrome oxidase Cu insertion factor (SCO1/SenC/PrrC family)